MKRVYFIKPVGMDGPIKIGCSCHPDGRRQNLDTWSPFALEIVASMEGDYTLERRFHAHFVHLHERREWFRSAPDLLATIDQIRVGAFDIDRLPDPLCVANRTNGNRAQRSPEFRQQLSYSLRVSHLERRTGYSCPVYPSDMIKAGDEARIRMVDAFLADPAAHGEHIDAPWAIEARAKLAASSAAE